MNIRDRKNLLLTVGMTTAVICIVVLFFFRTSVFVKILSGIVMLIMPFIYGIVIAYLLRPICLFFEKLFSKCFDRKKTGKRNGLFRICSIMLSLILMLVFLTLLVLAVLPELINSISGLLSQLPSALDQFEIWIQSLDKGDISHEIVTSIETTLDTLSENLTSFLQTDLLPYLQTIVSDVTSSFMDILNIVKNFGLGCIISAYILGSWERFCMQIKLIVYAVFPKKAADWLREEVHYTDRMFSGFIHGKLLDSLIIGVCCFIFCTIARMPYTMLITIIIGVTNIIPFFGPYLGAIPSAILVLTESPSKCLIFVVFIIVLQQIDGNLLNPRILGNRLGLSSFWILFSILFFGSMWGFIGMLIGTPLFAVLYDLIRRLVVFLLKKRGQNSLEEEYRKKYPAE